VVNSRQTTDWCPSLERSGQTTEALLWTVDR
jgi:hypothetical protein